MNLRNRKLEKSLKRRVRVELRKSREDWREFKRLRRGRHYHFPRWLGRLFFAAIFLPMVGPRFMSLNSLAGMVVFWALVTACWKAGQLVTILRASPQVPVLSLLPLSREQAFDFLWWRFFKSSSSLAIDFAILFSILGFRAGMEWSSFWSILFLAVVQWGGVVAAATCLVAYLPRRSLYPGAGVLAAAALACWFLNSSFIGMVEWISRLGYWIPPTGWILSSIGSGRAFGFFGNLWPIASMSALLFVFPLAWRHLRRTYILPELAPAGESARGVVEIARRRQSDGTEDDPFAGVKAAIRSRQFLAGFNWERAGWMERLVSRWLRPEQKLAAEFLDAGRLKWSGWGTLIFVASCGIGFFTFSLVENMPFVPFVLMGVVASWFARSWPGTSLRRIAGLDSAVCSVYPLGFRQIASVIIKLNATRLLVVIPLLVALGLVVVPGFNWNWLDVSLMFLKTLGVTTSLILLLPIFAISPGTNDTKNPAILLLLVFAIIVIGASGITLFFAGPPIAMIAIVITLGASAGCLWLYNGAYNYNWFDLQRQPDQQKQIPGR